jgi:DNA-3-methyladenine glycosylase
MPEKISRKRLPRAFYTQPSPALAQELLGKYLHRVVDGVELVGKIVETEAYAIGDEACHAFRGKTPRTEILFEEGGSSYVYFTYGMYHCFNVSANEQNAGEAVLIRAVEPVLGVEKMRELRPKARKDRDLTSGPGKLCQAFDLSRKENAIDLIESDTLYITRGERIPPNLIGVSTRIGINVARHFPWRFFVIDNEYVSPAKPVVP